jgi:hypothetical protein
MKKIITLNLLLALSTYVFAQHEHHETKADTTKPVVKSKSPRQMAMDIIGDNHVHIDYGSPSVRGRNIWNGLVAYNQVWATGAHKATWIEFGSDVKIVGKVVPKGKYGFFTIPSADTWTVILSKDWDMHLADNYNENNDVIRVSVKPIIKAEITEALTFKVKPVTEQKGIIALSWEYLEIPFDFENITANQELKK